MTMTLMCRRTLTAGLVLSLGAATLARGQDVLYRVGSGNASISNAALARESLGLKAAAAQQGAGDPFHEVYANTQNSGVLGSAEQWSNAFWTMAIRDPADEALGATLEPAADSLRAQLGIPKDQGVVVAMLADDGPAARAGLMQNDILMSLAGKPLAQADDLPKQLKAAGESPVQLEVLRAGKPLSLRVRPVYRVTLGEAVEEKTDYHIGVSASPADDTLRAHLQLPPGRGLVVGEVVAGSPAEKAGVKAHDILLEMGGKLLDSTEKLASLVHSSDGKATKLSLLRAGKPMSVDVTPERRTVKQPPRTEAVRFYRWGTPGHRFTTNQPLGNWVGQKGSDPHQQGPALWHMTRPEGTAGAQSATDPARLAKRIDDLSEEMKSLRKAVEDVRDALKAAGTAKPKD
jgi:S1-C subfamily serine protease